MFLIRKKNNNNEQVVVRNTFMQYVLYIAQMVFPIVTLPYVTRVLDVESYGIYNYSGSCMTYITLIINYGFILSSTREIAKADGNKDEISRIHSGVIMAKLMLVLVSGIVSVVMMFSIPLLQEYRLFFFLMFLGAVLNAFLPDYLFRGIEKMEILTYVFLICKTTTTILTFFLIRDQSDYMMLPVLNIISGSVSLLVSFWFLHREGYRTYYLRIKDGWKTIREGFTHFLSQASSYAFNAVNTLILGFYFGSAEIAYWSAAIQLMGTVQGLYGPISTSLYPYMVKTKNLSLVKKVMMLFMPCIIIATIVCYFLSGFIIGTFYGEQYGPAIWMFELLLLVLIFSFPAVMLGWPVLGAISKAKEITVSTTVSAVFQICCLLVLGVTHNMTMLNVCIARILTEAVMLLVRCYYCYKFRKEFS